MITTVDRLKSTTHCPHCLVELRPGGKYTEQTYTGLPDFPGGEIATLSAGGTGKLRSDGWKCPQCGFTRA